MRSGCWLVRKAKFLLIVLYILRSQPLKYKIIIFCTRKNSIRPKEFCIEISLKDISRQNSKDQSVAVLAISTNKIFHCVFNFSVGGKTKQLTKTVSFAPPQSSLRVSRKQNSLFPMGEVNKYLLPDKNSSHFPRVSCTFQRGQENDWRMVSTNSGCSC